MTRRQRIALGIVVGLIALVSMLPMNVVAAAGGRAGLTARAVAGTVWQGRLFDAAIGSVPLGDVDVALVPWSLLNGQPQLDLTAASLRGRVQLGDNPAITGATGTVAIGARIAPLPVTSVELGDVTVKFRDGRCVEADGRVRAVVAGRVAGIALPSGFSGRVRCDGREALFPLVGQSGLDRLDLRMAQGGAWRAVLTLRPSDPAAAAMLTAAGFMPAQGGYTLRASGR